MAENNAPATKRNRGPGKPWTKGQSGNPGGRPAGIAAIRDYIAENTDDGKTLAGFHLAVALEPAPKLRGPKGAEVLLEPTLKERQDSVAWLADRLWGKAVQATDVSIDSNSDALSFTIIRKVAG